jgi:hypothetical protein
MTMNRSRPLSLSGQVSVSDELRSIRELLLTEGVP